MRTDYSFRVRLNGLEPSYDAYSRAYAEVDGSTEPCAPPSSLSVAPKSTGGVVLFWGASVGAARYRVEYARLSASATSTADAVWVVADDDVSGLSYEMPGLVCGDRYAFRVSASGDWEESSEFGSPSSEIHATAGYSGVSTTTVPAPLNFRVVSTTTDIYGQFDCDACPGMIWR